MTKNVATLWCAGLFLLGGALSSQAQYTPNYWPAFPYDPDYALGLKELPPFRKYDGYTKYVPNRIPDAVWKQKVSKERILGPDGIEMIPVSPYNVDQTETWIAINPTNPNNIIASANDSRLNGVGGQYYMPSYYTLDGGKTWQESRTPINEFIDVSGGKRATIFDPGVFYDSQGWAYLTFGMTQLVGDDEADNGVFVTVSKDGGKTWSYVEPVTIHFEGTTEQPFEDKYLSTADVNPASPYKDNLYVVWTRFKKDRGIYFSRSTDAGGSWSIASVVPGGDAGSFQSPVPVVGPEGNIYVAWRRTTGDNTEAAVQMSKNGGETWAFPTPVVAQTVKTTGTYNSANNRTELVDKQRMRISSYPVMDADRSNGEHRGRVYIAQSGKEDNTPGIFMSWSDDEGKTWTQKKRIDNNTIGTDVFLPAIAVDPLTGTVAVLYYSSQNDPTNKGADAYVAVSGDGGQTFSHIRLTPETFFIDDPQDVSNQSTSFYWGDYTSMAAVDGKFYPCYWAPNGPQGTFHTLDVYTNILSNAPRPVEQLAASVSVENPAAITLSWVDPTRNMFNQDLDEFTIVIYRRVKGQGEYTKIAEVPAGTQTYTDNTTVDGVEYEYRVVAVSNGNEGSGTVITATAGGALKPMAPVLLTARPHADGIEVEFESPEFHVDNTPFHDYHSVELYADNQKLGSVAVSGTGIQAGEVAKAVFTVPVKKFYNVQIKAVGKRGDKETPSDLSSQTALVYAGAPLNTMMATFDSDDSVVYYTFGDKAGALWGRTDKAASSGSYSLTDSPDGNYKPLTTYEVIFAPVVVQPTTTSLSFEHIALVAEDDPAEVFISDDFGTSWKWLRNYNVNSSEKFGTTLANSDWDTQSLDVSPYIGDTLYIRFKLKTNFANTLDGWYIDNLRLDALPVGVEEQAAPTAYLGRVFPNPASGSAMVEYRLRNNAHVTMELFSAVGTKVVTLLDEYRTAGAHTQSVNVETLPNGVYFCRMTLNDGTVLVQKLSVAR